MLHFCKLISCKFGQMQPSKTNEDPLKGNSLILCQHGNKLGNSKSGKSLNGFPGESIQLWLREKSFERYLSWMSHYSITTGGERIYLHTFHLLENLHKENCKVKKSWENSTTHRRPQNKYNLMGIFSQPQTRKR